MLSKVNFSITQLEYVMAVHKYGHFAKAAEACFVTQPTLSMQIQKLEDELGVIIFDRSKKPILVTEVGARLIEQIQLILFEVRKIEGLLKTSSDVEGDLSVGIIPTIAPYILPRILPELEKKYPKMTLNIREMQTHRIIEALENDELDVGLLATPLKIPKIFERPLYYEPFLVLCKKNHAYGQLKKIKYTTLKDDDIWLLEEGHCLRHQILDICSMKKNKTRKFNFESGSLETLKNLVESYGGYTLLPQLSADHLSRSVVVIPFEKPAPGREIGLVYRREHYKSEMIDALTECIQASLPADLQKIEKKDLDILPVK